MGEWNVVVSATVAVFAIVALGGGLRKINWLTAEADASLLNIVVRVLVPCLIARSIVGNESLNEASNVWLPPLVGYFTLALGVGVSGLAAWWLGPLIGLRTPASRRTFALCVGVHNYGYLPIPLAEGLYGQGTPLLGVLFITNVGVDLAMWTLGVAVISGVHGLGGLRRIINAPSIAVAAALGLHFAGAGAWMPGFVMAVVSMLGACAVPVALLLIGATIVDAFGMESPQRGDGHGFGVMATACVLRLGVLAAMLMTLAAAVPMFGGTQQLQRVVMLHAAMPTAVFPIILARHFGGDPRTAARVAIATSAVSLVTIPLWLAGTRGWLG